MIVGELGPEPDDQERFKEEWQEKNMGGRFGKALRDTVKGEDFFTEH